MIWTTKGRDGPLGRPHLPQRESCNCSPSLPLTLASSTISLRRAQRSRPTSEHVAATWALVGLIWTVQLAVYPSLAWFNREQFKQWHADYTRRIGLIVGPLIGIEAVTGVIWVGTNPQMVWAWVGLGLIGAIWVSTAVVQVPIHRRLGRGWDRELIASLVKGNWVRTVAWSVRGVLVIAVSLG